MTSFSRFAPALFVLLWATGFIGAGYAMPHAEPFAFLFVRFALSAVLLLLIIWWWQAKALTPRAAMHAAIAGTMIHGVYLGGVFWAINHGMPAGLSALIIGLQPLVTTLLAGAVLGERVRPRHWAGLAIGFIGVVIVLSPRLGAIGGGVNAATVGACLASVVGISAGTVWQKRFVADADLLTGTLWQYAGGAVLVAVAALLLETGSYRLNGELVFAMAWLVLVLSIGAILLLMYLIRDGVVARVSSLFYLVPGVTAVMAWVLFGEALEPIQIGGIVIASLGVALATRDRRNSLPTGGA
ncbi:EamA family transporter [Chelativorans sp. ZYF759]|uniref:DMT family transporter n=1 Tax=Chelativorans sp. ZYF759 TaxID=2692213 RepID=UPI00145E46D4|nr:DMT family transporter [Chelativorans sp. ZYF759]NMG38250.1 EamA family transporter [Chelativorans sp. ZYF759]